MAMEIRKGRSYYYRSVRDGDTVHKIYIGSGPKAIQAEYGARLRQDRLVLDALALARDEQLLRTAEVQFAQAAQLGSNLLHADLFLRGCSWGSYKWRISRRAGACLA